MATSGSSFTPTSLGREENVEVGQPPGLFPYKCMWLSTQQSAPQTKGGICQHSPDLQRFTTTRSETEPQRRGVSRFS
ncbi:hypothetical protein TNCV_1174621 [Trichonephila clavipes]|nr:hypothetical protein TNCV_1174621 [Trichonephila clavipes]